MDDDFDDFDEEDDDDDLEDATELDFFFVLPFLSCLLKFECYVKI